MLADGVPADKLYPMDIDRAFRKMSELKPHIKTWWREGSQSQQLIRDGEVDMIAMWSARGVDLIEDKVPLELVWNGAEIYYANLLVPKGNPRAKLAWEFCNFVAQAKPQADFAMLLPYGPANPGARALMTEARLRQTPAWPDNEKVSLQARCRLDRATARADPRAMDAMADHLMDLRVFCRLLKNSPRHSGAAWGRTRNPCCGV